VLVRETYVPPRRDPAPLLEFDDGPALRTHLFEQLIPAVVDSRPPGTEPFLPRRRYDPAKVREWLTILATLLEHPGGPPDRDIAWWRLARRSDVLNGWFGAGLWWVLREWESDSPGYADLRLRGRVYDFWTELVVTVSKLAVRMEDGLGKVLGTITLLAFLPPLVVATPKEPAQPAVPPSTVPPSSSAPPTTVLITPTTHQDEVGLDNWISAAAVTLASFVLGAALLLLAVVVVRWSATTADRHSATSPRRSFRADRALTGVRTAVLGTATAVAAGGIVGVATWTSSDAPNVFGVVAFAATAGLLAALGALALGKHHAWLVYSVATTVLAAQGRLPWRLMSFLDDAQRLGLLRTLGPVYQFRHADLQDHLRVPT
jgi:hypothetical protein